jgi:hypothetical protein
MCPEAGTTSTDEKNGSKEKTACSGNQPQNTKPDGINLKVHVALSLCPSECCLHGLWVHNNWDSVSQYQASEELYFFVYNLFNDMDRNCSIT